MKKQEILNKLQVEIDENERKLAETDETDLVQQGIILGRINGLLTAKLIVMEYVEVTK